MSRLDAKLKAPSGFGRPAHTPVDPASLDRDLEGLAALPLDQLRVQFRNRTGRIAPTRTSRPLLLRVLAYRVQADRFGDLRPETRRLLERVASAGQTETGPADRSSAVASAEARMKPRTGTVLVREWQGRMQRVTVSEAGYDWNATSYPSLSAVATAITGTKWNGRRFFGLDQAVKTDPTRSKPTGHRRHPAATEQAALVGAAP